MICFAVVFGLLAVFVARSWLNTQAAMRAKDTPQPAQTVAMNKVVIAAAPLRFGNPLTAQSLREVEWPRDAIPVGTFGSINDLLAGGQRIVLASIEPNEPILRLKVTGPGQRATLSAIIGQGFRAVTVRVNDVEGVGGFVLPGDHVDVLMTRSQNNAGAASNDVVIQNVRVLAVDQIADDSTAKPIVARAVTLEVDTTAAQKLSLASTLGTLSLSLRKAGESAFDSTRRITVTDLGNGAPIQSKRYSTIVVTRQNKSKQEREEYSVPNESIADIGEMTGADQR
jgi:pilus assembly protein CpaB